MNLLLLNNNAKCPRQGVKDMYNCLHGLAQRSYNFKRDRSNDMSNYELQILATEQYYDDAIRAAEQENIEVLSSVVPGSRLHQIIHNPIDSGIDEG